MVQPLIPGGYILLSRKILNNEIMKKPPLYFKIWTWILLNAQHKDYGNLKRGQLFTSIPEMQEAMSYKVGYRTEKPTKKQIWGVLEWLRNPYEGNTKVTTNVPMIETTKVTHGIIITVVNYDLYQTPSNYEGNNEGNNEGTTKEQRRERQGNNINKNDKNDKNEKEDTNNIMSQQSSDDNKPTESAIKFDEDSIEIQLARFMIQEMLRVKPDSKVPKDDVKSLQAWAQHIDYMIRLDKRTPRQIAELFRWAQQDDFWCANIRSPQKLRKQWDTLELRRQKDKKPNARKQNTNLSKLEEMYQQALEEEGGIKWI